jgi:hypothetical protein
MDIMGLKPNDQDPVSAFHSKPNNPNQETLEAEILGEGDGQSFKQEFSPEQNQTKVGFTGNGVVKGVLIAGGVGLLAVGAVAFYSSQLPKEKAPATLKSKSPTDDKLSAAQSAATKAQQSESATKAELALAKQKESLDQASKNDESSQVAAIDKQATTTTSNTTSDVAVQSTPLQSNSARNPTVISTASAGKTTNSSVNVPIVPVLRPAVIASSTTSRLNTQPQSARKNPATNSSIAFVPSPGLALAKPLATANKLNSISSATSRAQPLSTAIPRPAKPAAPSPNTFTPTNFPVASTGKKSTVVASIPATKSQPNLALKPIAIPGYQNENKNQSLAAVPAASIPNSFGNPAIGSALATPALVASATIPTEINSDKNSTKTLFDYLSRSTVPPTLFRPVDPKQQLQVATIPGFGSTAPSSTPSSSAPANGIKIAQNSTTRPSLPAVADFPSGDIVTAVSGPTLTDAIKLVQSSASQPADAFSLAAGIRAVQNNAANTGVFQVASTDLSNSISLGNNSTRPAFHNTKLTGLQLTNSGKSNDLTKADATKPFTSSLTIAKSILVGNSAKGTTLTPILWNGGASSNAKFIIKLEENLSDNNGQMALPAGSQLIVVAKAASNTPMADLEVVSIVISGIEYTAPIGAITVRDDNNGLLIGDDYFKRGEQAANRDVLSVLTGAIGGLGKGINQSTSTITVNGGGSSSTVSNGGQSLLGSILEGGFKDLPNTWIQRNQQALQEIASKPNVYQIPKGKAVRIFVNKTIDF